MLTLTLWTCLHQASYSAEKEEDEQKVTLDQTPSAVQETIKRETAGGSIQEIEKETEDGKTVFEAEFNKDGKEFELTVAEDGKVLGVEEEGKNDDDDEDEDEAEENEQTVTLDQTPVAVQETINRETAGGSIKEIEKEIEKGKTVYEAEFIRNGETYELTVAEDGKVLGMKEDEDDEDDDEGKEGESEKITFEDAAVGKVPKGCLITETNGKGSMGTWKVMEMEGAPSGKKVFALTESKNSGSTFNLAIAEEANTKDLELGVKVKALSGQEDQGGGPIWRVKDANNYYICRWNPLEENFRVYYVKDGKRKELGSAKVEADSKAWHEIEIKMVGSEIKAEFDDKLLIELKDDTFAEGGMVGVWTKADACTAFDDFEVEKTKREGHEHKQPKEEKK